MKLSISLLAALHISSSFVAAQPFVIFNTRVQDVLPTQTLVPRQNLIDTINSALSADFGGGDASSTTLAPAVTRAPPAAASTTTSSKASKHTKPTSSDDDSQGSAATSSQDGSAATSSSSGSTSTSISSTHTSTSTSTPVPHSTTTPAPTATLATSTTPTPSTNADGNNSTVPAGGVAVAVIMCLVIVAVTMFLVFRYNARCQAWWAAREERLRHERSYRDAIDGPGSSSLRQQALSGGSSRRRTMLASFFAPSTARLSDNTEIRRKPVNWGAPAVPAVPKIPDAYSPAPQPEIEDEKLSLTASAAPLGQIERYSMIPVATQLPAPPLPPKPLPPPKPEHHTSPTFLPIPTSGSFVAELPACVPTTSPPQSRSISERQTQPTTLTRNLTNPHGFGGPLPATRYEPNPGPKTPTAPTHPMTLPVSPVSLHPNATSPNLGPVSPMSTYTTRSAGFDHSRSISTMTTSTTTSNSNARRESIPMLPPLPAIPGLIHAKRGSDGVFRLT